MDTDTDIDAYNDAIFRIDIANKGLHRSQQFGDCTDEISKCEQTNSLLDALNNFQHQTSIDTLNMNINQLLNCYHHVLQQHQSDNHIDFINQSLKNCNISKCIQFERNYRNRQELNEKHVTHDSYTICVQDIMDKIHCYFAHAYDTGNKLTNTNRLLLMDNNTQYENILKQW
eukprot:351880_1